METKKSPKANLENKRKIFLLLGLVIALGIVLITFEWTSKPSKIVDLGNLNTLQIEEEIIPITREQEIKPPPPPPPPKVIEVLNIVDNDVKIDEDLQIDDSEADDNTLITVAPVISAAKEEEEEEAQVFFIVEEMPDRKSVV